MASATVLRKSQIFRDLSVDVAAKALIVSYSTETVYANPDGSPGKTETTNHKKRIRIKSIDASTDVNGLAGAIMASADLIPKEKRDLLVELLVHLQKSVAGQGEGEDVPSKRSSRSDRPSRTGEREEGGSSNARIPSGERRSSRRTERPTLDHVDGKELEHNAKDMERGEPSFISSGRKSSGSRSRPYSSQYGSDVQTPTEPPMPLFPVEPDAPVDDDNPNCVPEELEEYLEQLYEDDLVLKIEAVRKILYVAQRGQHIVHVANNSTLLGALARTARDEYRKSVDLTLAIMQVWYCLAHFKVFHQHIVNARVGDVCLRAVELEQRRHIARMIDLERFEKLAEIQATGDEKAEEKFRRQDAIQRERESKREASADAALKAKTENFEGKADEIEEQDTVPRRMRSKPLPEGKIDIQRERQRVMAHKRKSEGLQYVCLSILLFLAEDLEIERKMCKRGVVGLLVPLLQRTDNLRLVQLSVRFLRKLSIFEENKNAMVALGAGSMLASLLPSPEEARVTVATANVTTGLNALVTDLRSSVMHLMFNLTFDPTMAAAFLHANAVGKSTALLRVSSFRQIALKLLYRLSTDYPVRGRFATANAVRLVMSLVLKFPNPRLPLELAGLGINLCLHPATAGAILSRPSNVAGLVKRLVNTADPSVAKMIHGLTQYTYGLQADAHLRAQAEEDMLRTPRRVLEALGLPVPRRKRRDKDKRGRQSSAYDEEENDRNTEQTQGTMKRTLSRTDSMTRMENPDQDFDEPYGANWDPYEYSPFLGTYVPDSNRRVRYRYEFIDLWHEHVDSFLRVLVAAEKQDIVEMTVEMLGIFANLTPLDLAGKGPTWRTLAENEDFMYILTTRIDPGLNSPMGESYLNQIHYDMDAVDPITRHLSALGPEDDVLLEAIQVISTMALDPATAPMILAADIPRLLAEVAAARSALDYDVTLQAIVALARCLIHPEIIEKVTQTRVSERVAELLSHPHVAIAAEASDAARLLIEQDREHGTGELAQMLIARRFAVYNREWLQDFNATAGRRYHNQSSSAAQELLRKQVQMQTEAEIIAERARANKLGLAQPAGPIEVVPKEIKYDPRAYPLAYIDEWEVADPLPKASKASGASLELREHGVVADESFDVDDGGDDDDDDEHELSDRYEEEMLQGGLGGISLHQDRDLGASGRSHDFDAQSGSPLKPMGRYGEAVAFDIGYLYSAASGAGEKLASGIYDDTVDPAERKEMERMLAEAFEGRRDGVEINSEHYDYYEDAIEIPGEEHISEDEDEVSDAAKDLVNTYMR